VTPTPFAHATLSRGRRATIAFGLLAGVGCLAYALPEQHLAYAEVVPLLLLARAYGLGPGIATSLVVAPLLNDLQHRSAFVSLQSFSVEAAFLFAVFVAVLTLVDRYEEVLFRSYVSETERLGRIPDQVRREEAALRERDLSAIAESIPQLVWRAQADGSVEYFNAAWITYTGIEPSAPYEDAFQEAIHRDDAAAVRERWEAALCDGVDYAVQFRMRSRDGAYRWFLARATPLRDPAGAIVRWFGTCTDIDDQKRAHERLERRFEIAQRVSLAFQESSLPTTLPDLPGLRFSALYQAGRREATVGGDWYDALRLLDGRIMVSIGDVAGSGLGAAITMATMRQAIRGAAQVSADPMLLLEAADRTLREDAPDRMVTAFVGVYDPTTRELAYASAGHPAPLARMPDGSVVELDAPGLPLGVRRPGDTLERRLIVQPGTVLVLYTDGLVESTHDLMAGERRLRAAVAALDPQASGAADRIARAALIGPIRDDVAILTLTFDASDDGRYRHWSFDSSDRFAARDVRASLTSALAALGANAERLSEAELVLAELLGNVVRHARGLCEVVLDANGPLPVLSVLDRGAGCELAPTQRSDALAESGRGLLIVRALAAGFNLLARPGGGTQARAVLRVDGEPDAMLQSRLA
jgi:PAS domain S-box-containing protein